ncbi:MAG TPA: hypothetical protein VGJ45_33170 [Pseudonocardiaceae bacterium]|jgi:hypothetical protein
MRTRATLQSGVLLHPTSYATSDLFGAAIPAGQERGEIRADVDAASIGRLLMDGYLGIVYRWAAEDDAPPPEADFRRLVDIVFDGLNNPK